MHREVDGHRCLTFASLSAPALLMVVATLSFSPMARGGVQSDSERLKLHSFFAFSVVHAASQVRARHLLLRYLRTHPRGWHSG